LLGARRRGQAEQNCGKREKLLQKPKVPAVTA
jgi:hypothetical protein